VGLVGLSGWFITMSALVGLLGITSFSYLFPSGGIRAFALLRTIARYGERIISHQATFRWLARLRVSFFAKALRLPEQQLNSLRSGELLNHVMADVDTLDQVLLRALIPTLSTLVIVAGGLLFIGNQSALMAVLILPSLLIVGLILPIVTRKRGRRPGTQLVATRARLRTAGIEALQGRREIIAYQAEEIVKRQFLQQMALFDRAQEVMRRMSAASTAVTGGLASLTVLAALSVGLLLLNGKELSGPVVVMICLLVMGLFESVEGLPLAYQFVGVVRQAAQQLNRVFLVAEQERARPGSLPFPDDQTLSVRGLSFRYGGQQRDVLHALTSVIAPGTLVAVTGRSGSGKSTLLKLLARELEASDGSIDLGTGALDAIAEETFRQHVALVSQDSHVFNATLRENLLLARPEASAEELLNVLAAVRLTELLQRLTDGLDSRVGEQGYTLSGGERRRLSIAQALLKAPSILLLDEPTAGIDHQTAREMLVAIRSLLPESTLVIATHDPWCAELADQQVTL